MTNSSEGKIADGESKDTPAMEMSRGAQTAWIVGAIVAAGILVATALVNSTSGDGLLLAEKHDQVSPLEREPSKSAEEDSAIARAEARVAEAQAQFDAAMNDLDSNGTRYARHDPELEMGSRQAVELNEMICRETGQNCEVAKMARKHHIERYGRF